MEDTKSVQPLPTSGAQLRGPADVAKLLATRFLKGQPAIMLRYGDTGGRIMARPPVGGEEHAYIRNFLGASVTVDQIDWLASRIEDSIALADVIGLRSDLLGEEMLGDLLSSPDAEILSRLAARFPLRDYERTSLKPDDARRLAQTRLAMERLRLPAKAMLTDAWIHVGLAEIGLYSAFFRNAPGVSICTSAQSREVLKVLAAQMGPRLRVFECPAYPWQERSWGADHAFLWDRWIALQAAARPTYDGEPLLISAGIWTKVLAQEWAKHGGVAIDMGSVMDYFALDPTRPAVLATRYGDSKTVPNELAIAQQLSRTERIEDFVDEAY